MCFGQGQSWTQKVGSERLAISESSRFLIKFGKIPKQAENLPKKENVQNFYPWKMSFVDKLKLSIILLFLYFN
jgi:hypothetical protein